MASRGAAERRPPARRIALAWLVWLGGLVAVALLDYTLRRGDGDIKTGGVPEPLGGALLMLIGVGSVWMLYRATRHLAVWKWLTLVCLQAVIGYVIGTVIAVAYVCGAGIDCM